MSDDNSGIYTCLSKPVPTVYLNLLKPRAFGAKGKERGDPKYSANFYFDPEDGQITDMKAIAVTVAKAHFGNNVDLKSLAWPWKSGNKVADRSLEKKRNKDANAEPSPVDEAARGKYVIAARSKFRPQLSYLDPNSRRIIQLEDEAAITKALKTYFYFGVETLPQFKFQAYDALKDGDPNGVNVFLNQVFSTGKGTKLGGDGAGSNAAETFSGYVGGLSAEDPTGGQSNDPLGDDIPF